MRPAPVRFWEKVRKTRSCWLWTGAVLTDGYGAFKMPNGKSYGAQKRAHRIAWALTYGAPGNAQILHTCDNPLCVNPKHLFSGTHQDNMADKIAKKRQARGDTCGRSKLTSREVRAIRRKASHVAQYELAEEYGVSPTAINKIVNRKTWKHI